MTVPGAQVEIFSANGVDAAEAQARLQARRETLASEIDRAQRKLSNEGFLAKAPAAVVQGERDKLERWRAELQAL